MPDRLDESGRELYRVIDHYAPEADVNRRCAVAKERGELGIRLIIRGVAEEKAANIWKVLLASKPLEIYQKGKGTCQYGLANLPAWAPTMVTSSM
jgi:hypothetical protein